MTKQDRAEIVEAFLRNPEEGEALAVSMGLRPDYAYKLVHALGLLPRTGKRYGRRIREGA